MDKGWPQAISVEELAEWRKRDEAVQILDVREAWELDVCRISGSDAIRMAELPRRLDELARDRPVVIVCHHGVRSRQVVFWLRHGGWTNVINLDGGLDAWARRVDPDMATY